MIGDTTAQPEKTLINFINYESGLSVAVMQEGFLNRSPQAALCEKRIGSRPPNVRVPGRKR